MDPQRYYRLIDEHQEMQLLFTAIDMEAFTFLDEPHNPEDLSRFLGCSARNAELFLMTLASRGYVVKKGDAYFNTEESSLYLSKRSPVYLGDSILFREAMTSLDDLKEKMLGHHGGGQEYDFVKLIESSVPEMYSGRVQSFVEFVMGLYPDTDCALSVLDLGGGSGILDVELMKVYQHGKATVFDQPRVINVARDIVRRHGGERISFMSGDFNVDPLGGKYDLIIASGVLFFVTAPMKEFIAKAVSSLDEGGRLIIAGQKPEAVEGDPNGMLSWLSGYLNGLPLPVTHSELNAALQGNGLFLESTQDVGGFETSSYVLGNPSEVSTQDVIDSFIQLTEAIFNSKTNVLDFGSEDMVFTRGEIHIIKMIGDSPGTYSAELARKFRISKPVIHATIKKMIAKGLIRSEMDRANNKIYKLYLTEKGQRAYRFHEEYHNRYDKGLFDFVSEVPVTSLADIQKFLSHAIELINNHSGDVNGQ
jgi:DNA-binding MarR family transcriptional regulator